MLKFVGLSLVSGVVTLLAAVPAEACGGSDGSCSMGVAPVATASAKATRSNSYAPPASTYRAPMMLRGGLMGGGSGNGVPHSAGAKVRGN